MNKKGLTAAEIMLIIFNIFLIFLIAVVLISYNNAKKEKVALDYGIEGDSELYSEKGAVGELPSIKVGYFMIVIYLVFIDALLILAYLKFKLKR